MPAGRPPKAPDPDVQKIIDSIDKSGASKLFYNIRRRLSGASPLLSWWKRGIPVDSVDDLVDFLNKESGPYYDYKVEVRDGQGKPTPHIKDFMIMATEMPPEEVLAANPIARPVGGAGGPNTVEMQLLQQQQQEMAVKRQQLQLAQQQRALDREQRRLERQMEEEAGGDEDGGPPNPYLQNPYVNPYMMHPMMQPPWMQPPWMQQQRQQQSGEDKESSLIKAMAAFATALRPPEPKNDSTEMLIKLLAVLKPDTSGFNPKDMLGILSPILAESNKMSQESSRMLLTSMSEMDKAFRERMMDMILSDPTREPDEVEKFRKYLNLGTESLGKLVGVWRATGGAEKKEPGKVGQEKRPGLPAPKTQQKDPATKEPDAPPADAKAAAAELVKARVTTFLEMLEQESAIQSDPDMIAEKIEELFFLLPKPLREKIMTSDTGDSLTAMGEHAPEVVKRIMETVSADESKDLRKWYEEFFEALKGDPDDEEGDDEGGEEEPEPEPEPEGEPKEEPEKEKTGA